MVELAANMKVNGERLWDSLMEMAKIGPGVAGGNNRQTLTDEDAEGRRLFQTWCDAEKLTMGIDQMVICLQLVWVRTLQHFLYTLEVTWTLNRLEGSMMACWECWED